MHRAADILSTRDWTVPTESAVAALREKVAQQLGWEPVQDLLRLKGFTEDWELTVLDGKVRCGHRFVPRFLPACHELIHAT